MRRIWKYLATLLLGVALGTATGCHKQTAAMPQMPPPLVTVAPAVSQDVPVYLDEIGTATAFESVVIIPQVSGPIMERHVEDGADVTKGQVLFNIDPRPFEAALHAAEALTAQANAALDLAHTQLKMYDAVADTRAISQTDYDAKKNAVAVDETLVQEAQAAVELARLNLDYCTIKCPIDGRAGRRLVDAGNVVTANQTALLSIQRLDPIYTDFTITERELPQVQEQMAHGQLHALVRLPAEPEASARSGDLTFIDNAVQGGTGTVTLRATVPNADHHFWPGQFVRVRLVLEIKKGAVLVPTQAVQTAQQGPYVYVVTADGTAVQRPVTLGQKHSDLSVVENGVTAGEQVVVLGQMLVIPGLKVHVQATTGPTTAPTTAATAP